MSPKITFFSPKGGKHQQAIGPIADLAENRGFTIEFSPNSRSKKDIGIFTSAESLHHPKTYTDLSVVLFHGIDSAYYSGAKRWNWSRFDIGLLPGPAAAAEWQKQAVHPAARPKLGAFEVGWPKSDRLFSDEFSQEVRAYRNSLELNYERTVLYAPSFEAHGNLLNFCNQLSDSRCNLLIKHGSYDVGDFSDESINSLYTDCQEQESVEILDSDTNILYPLAIADIVVTDSLSVCLEGLLTETVPVAVTDWQKRSGEFWAAAMPEFVIRHESEKLRDFVTSHDFGSHLEGVRNHRKKHFSNLGTSAEVTVDLLECAYNGRKLPVQPLTPVSDGFRSASRMPTHTLHNTYLYIVGLGRVKISERQKRWLKRARIDRLVQHINNGLDRIQ